MADVTRLLAALIDYRDVLAARHQRVRDAHADLTGRYQALAAVYEGRGASEFKAGWRQVDAAFEGYRDGVPRVLSLFDDKIERLRRLDAEF